jgi:hypothetical protein
MKKNKKSIINDLYQQKMKMSGGDPISSIFKSPNIFSKLQKSLSKNLPPVLATINSSDETNYIIKKVYNEKKKNINAIKQSEKNIHLKNILAKIIPQKKNR